MKVMMKLILKVRTVEVQTPSTFEDGHMVRLIKKTA
jgi:hypothetical protein